MEFKKNELINSVLLNYYETFALTLNSEDFVSPKYNKKIEKYIFKNMKKKFSSCNKEYREWLRKKKRKLRIKNKLKRKEKNKLLRLKIKEKIKLLRLKIKYIFKRRKNKVKEDILD